MRGCTRVHIPICVELLQRHCVQNICKGGLVLGRRWVQGTARTIGAVGVGAVEVIGRRSSSEMCLSSTRKRWRWTGLLLVERSSARAGAKDALARHQPHLEVVAPWISPWTGATPRVVATSLALAAPPRARRRTRGRQCCWGSSEGRCRRWWSARRRRGASWHGEGCSRGGRRELGLLQGKQRLSLKE